MKTIEPHTKNYVDNSIDKAAIRFQTAMQHEIGLLQDFWRHEFSLVIEMLKDKPSRDEVRDIVRDELRYHGFHR